MLTLKYYQRHSKLWSFRNLTIMWRHHDVISSQDSSKVGHFPLSIMAIFWNLFLKFYFWNFWKVCWRKHSCEKIFEILRKRNHAYSRIIFEWYGVVLEHFSGSFHFQHDYNWRGILYFFSCQFWFFIFELVFESFFEPKFHFYSSQVFHPFESSF